MNNEIDLYEWWNQSKLKNLKINVFMSFFNRKKKKLEQNIPIFTLSI